MILVVLAALCCVSLMPAASQAAHCPAFKCMNGGKCLRMCNCSADYEGDRCGNLTDWRDSNCSSPNCSVAENSTCFNGVCLCQPGYYYSVGTKQCVEECCMGRLQTTYSAYVGYNIHGHNNKTINGTTRQNCQNTCSGDVICRTFEFNEKTTKCHLQTITALDEPHTFKPVADWVLYQKDCE